MGLINYTPGTELTRGQLTWVVRQAKENAGLLKHPEAYHIAKVAKSTKKDLLFAGFQVTKNNTAIIPKKGNDKVRLKRGGIVYTGKTANGTVIHETVTLSNSANFHKKLKRLMEAGDLPKNKMITAKIGESAIFNKRFSSYYELMYYLEKWQPDDVGESRENIARYFSIVEIETPKGTDYAKEYAIEQKQLRKDRTIQQKARKTKFKRK